MARGSRKLWRMSRRAVERLLIESLEKADEMVWDVRRWDTEPGIAAKWTIKRYWKQAEACEEELRRRRQRRPIPRAPSRHPMVLRSRR